MSNKSLDPADQNLKIIDGELEADILSSNI